jgi:hypothetical protein
MTLLHIIVFILCLNVPTINAVGISITDSTCPAPGFNSQAYVGMGLIATGMMMTVGGLKLIGDSALDRGYNELESERSEQNMRCKMGKGATTVAAGVFISTVGWCTILGGLSTQYKKILNCTDY